MWSIACKNDNSVYLHFLIMSPDPYFHFISGLYLNNHLKYFNDTLQDTRISHARMKTLHFSIISPDPYL